MSELTKIKDFLQVSDRISTAGQPTQAEFSTIRDAGHRTVINLAVADSPGALANESEIVQDLGLDYIHIPVVWESPNIQDALRFFEVMNQRESETVFIHCAANKRVSAFLFLYRVLCLGEQQVNAQRSLLQVWTPNVIWQTFIDQMVSEFAPRSAPSI
ncbi:MAG: protein tyrosine phosphatase family protein [Cyanobacteria bacterium P01_F01_bin.42]